MIRAALCALGWAVFGAVLVMDAADTRRRVAAGLAGAQGDPRVSRGD